MTKKEYRDLLDRYKERTILINKSTIESLLEETPEQQEARIKWLLKPENYNDFFNYYFGKDTPIPLADSDSAWFHVDIYKDLFYNNYITLFNLLFRGGAKSTHANLGYPIGLKQNAVCKFFLTVGANEKRAAMLLQDLQIQFESNNRLIKDFGMQKSIGSWAEGQFETTDRCTFMALGIEQPFRGLRANGVRLEYVSLDDIEDKKKTLNQRIVQEYSDKVTGDIQGAFSKSSERTIINNNYFTNSGFIAHLLNKKGFDPKKIDTKHNQVIKEKYSTVYLINLTTKYYQDIKANPNCDWKPSWDRFSREDCLRKIEQYKNDEATLSNEFYNTPIKVGKRIKAEWIKIVKPKPLKDYIIIVGNFDFAYGDDACYKGYAVVGVHPTGMTVLDIFCRQTDINVGLDYHFINSKKRTAENPNCMYFYDGSVAQEVVYSPVILQSAIKHKGYSVMLLPQKSSTDKYTKIDTVLVSVLASGILDFSEELLENPDWDEAQNQMLNFQKGGNYPVDFPDALADAIIQINNLYVIGQEQETTKPSFGKRDYNKGY